MAILNSSAVEEWLVPRRRSKIHLYPDDWKALPIPLATSDQQAEVCDVVDEILQLYSSQGPSLTSEGLDRLRSLDQAIDRMVNGLYALSDERIESADARQK